MIALVWLLLVLAAASSGKLYEDCDNYVSKELRNEIASYQTIVNRIVQEVVRGKFQNYTYDQLALFVDTFGNRLAGTENLENSIDYMLQKLSQAKLDNVHGEDVTVPYWHRGNESLEMIAPRYQPINMLGLGYSIGTPPEGIQAEAIVFESFDDMEAHSDQIKGKIVVFNQKFVSYGETVQYRSSAAARAGKYGAVAAIIASITPFSLDLPHTGTMHYDEKVKKIPSAAIPTADANLLARLQKRGTKIQLRLKMEAENRGDKISRNVFADIKGSEKPKSLVIVSGHIDSWDVGQGAMDDGAGAFISWIALDVLNQLGLRARRTLRSILWTGEEEGLIGASAYFEKQDVRDINFIMESDIGTFKPIGFDVAGTYQTQCIFREVMNLLSFIDINQLIAKKSVGSDIAIWTDVGVPGASLNTVNSQYFWYHHTNADTMDVENSTELDLCTATWAATAYVIADLSVDMPKKLRRKSFKYNKKY